MKLNIVKTFAFAHGGYRVVEYAEGSEVETDDQELIEVSTDEGWAAIEGQARKAPEKAAIPAAQQTKAKKA